MTVSLSTLRAELTGLELRIVDRLNGALAQKADRDGFDALLSNVVKNEARLTVLEQRAVVIDSPLTQKISDLDDEMTTLREIGKYKKWMWAQTIALAGIALAVIGVVIQQGSTPL